LELVQTAQHGRSQTSIHNSSMGKQDCTFTEVLFFFLEIFYLYDPTSKFQE